LKLWIRGNYKPRIRGTDEAIWRRIRLIPFLVQIPGAELDPKLLERLKAELPGVLRWAVNGCLAWQSDGLKPPVAVTGATDEYRADSDETGQFMDECCVLSSNAKVGSGALHHEYRAWAEARKIPAMGIRAFSNLLETKGFRKKKEPSGQVFQGVGLRA
jgi:putative DNA primase/helicase